MERGIDRCLRKLIDVESSEISDYHLAAYVDLLVRGTLEVLFRCFRQPLPALYSGHSLPAKMIANDIKGRVEVGKNTVGGILQLAKSGF